MSNPAGVPPTDAVAALFDRLADSYDGAATRFFPFCADRLVDSMGLRPGLKVLDVGTGTGAIAVSAAQRVRPDGRVLAVDLSGRMLDQAYDNARRMGLQGLVDLHDMDATRLDFRSDYFDVLLSGFVLFFLQDMEAVLREWQRVLKPGGRIGLSVFDKGAFEPMASLFRHQLSEVLPEVSVDHNFLWERLAEPEVCHALMEAAGFVDVEVEQVDVGYRVERSMDWWELLWRTGFRGYIEQLSEQDQAAFQTAHLREVDKLFEEGVLKIPVPALLVRATRPK